MTDEAKLVLAIVANNWQYDEGCEVGGAPCEECLADPLEHGGCAFVARETLRVMREAGYTILPPATSA